MLPKNNFTNFFSGKGHNYFVDGESGAKDITFSRTGTGGGITFAFFIGVVSVLFLGVVFAPAHASSADTKGEVLSAKRDNIEITQGERKEYSARIKNTGSRVWQKGKVALETGPFLRSSSKFKDESWLRYFQPQDLDQDISPGEVAHVSFYLQAPGDISGLIQEKFQLVFDNRPISGTELTLFIDVLKDAPEESFSETPQENNEQSSLRSQEDESATEGNTSSGDQERTEKQENTSSEEKDSDFCISLTQQEKEQYERCNTDPQEEATTDGKTEEIELQEEPQIRVGLFKTDSAERIKCNGHFDVYAGDELLLSGLSPNVTPSMSYNQEEDKYYISTQGITRSSQQPLRIIPRNNNGVVELVDYTDTPSWNPSINYNKFRNIIEFNYSEAKEELWVINELPMSSYIKGLAETTDYSPQGFKKVIATVARTYGMYHYNRGVEHGLKNASTKHQEENFHVDATYDQVYKGYASEDQMPDYSRAVEETKGTVVTYKDKVVVTPYFSQSDGRTRSWEEVWHGGGKPWLKSVEVPREEGEELWGHGVGLSARGALLIIREDDRGWKETLEYFYQNTDLETVYK